MKLRRFSQPRKRGAALIIAMLLTALGAAVAAQMLSPMAGWLAREYSARDSQASYTLADAASAWAVTVLAGDLRFGPVDHYGELWATVLPPTPVEGGTVEGRITDLQAKFNLNNLAPGGVQNKAAVEFAKTLFTRAGVPAELAVTLADALDRDNMTEEGQSESQRYGGLLRNVALKRLDELLTIPGFTEARVRALLATGEVDLLPTATPININTASPELLALAFPRVNADLLAAAITRRTQQPYQGVNDFLSTMRVTENYDGLFGVSTQFFSVDAIIRFERSAHRVQLRLQRPLGQPPQLYSRVINNA